MTIKLTGIDQTLIGPFQPVAGDTSLPVYPIATGKATGKALKDLWVISKRIGYPLANLVRARPDTGDTLEAVEDMDIFVHKPAMLDHAPDNLRILSRYGCTDLPTSMLVRAGGEVYLSTRAQDIRPPRMQRFPWARAIRQASASRMAG